MTTPSATATTTAAPGPRPSSSKDSPRYGGQPPSVVRRRELTVVPEQAFVTTTEQHGRQGPSRPRRCPHGSHRFPHLKEKACPRPPRVRAWAAARRTSA